MEGLSKELQKKNKEMGDDNRRLQLDQQRAHQELKQKFETSLEYDIISYHTTSHIINGICHMNMLVYE